jgi:PAS domain S-box-containing protein
MEGEHLDFRLLFESSIEGMLIVASEERVPGRILDANPEACRLTRRRHEDLTATECKEVFDRYDPRLRSAFEEFRRTGKFKDRLRLLRQGGEPFTAEVSMVAFGKEKAGISFWDATGRVQAEEELQSSNESLEHQVALQAKQLEPAMSEADDYQQMLEENIDRLRAVFEQTAVGLAQVGVDGRWQWINQKLYDIVGYPSEELLEMNFRDLTHPKDLRNSQEHMRRLLAGEIQSYSVEERYMRKDESIVWVNVTVSLPEQSSKDPEYFIAVVEDIAERKRTEESLTQSKDLYRTVVEQAVENIFVVDVETKRILEANTAFHRAIGYAPDELRQMTLYDIVAHDRESVDRNVRRILEQGRLSIGERRCQRKDGSLLEVDVNVSTVLHDGKPAMCITAHDVSERNQAAERLRRSLGVMLALREAGQTLDSTLKSEEIVSRLLEIMQSVSNLTAGVISLWEEDNGLQIWRSVGLQRLWRRARFAPEAEAARQAALEMEEQRLFQLRKPEPETGHLVGLCLPLRMQEEVVGVLEAYGPESLADRDTVELIASITAQAARALENARLYEELAERERRRQDLLERLLGAQEEERRHVAYEVHDGLAQVATAAHQRLQAFVHRHHLDTERGQRDLKRILDLVQQTVSDARRIIANLRPTALDDLGLAAAISQEIERLRDDGYHVDYEERLGDERLPATVEITLFRVAQEALTNMRKHAQTSRLEVSFWYGRRMARLEVRDEGRGFDVEAASAGSGPGERIGLIGMKERVRMLRGKLDIQSSPGFGTAVIASVPL